MMTQIHLVDMMIAILDVQYDRGSNNGQIQRRGS